MDYLVLEARRNELEELSVSERSMISSARIPRTTSCALSGTRRAGILKTKPSPVKLTSPFSAELNLPLIRLSISRDNIKKSHIDILKKLDLKFLNSPGDPIDQSPEVFFEKL